MENNQFDYCSITNNTLDLRFYYIDDVFIEELKKITNSDTIREISFNIQRSIYPLKELKNIFKNIFSNLKKINGKTIF
jgi:hypothetical protein